MSKGKNFNAAEKYFMGKIEKLRKELKEEAEKTIRVSNHNRELNTQIETLKQEVQEYKAALNFYQEQVHYLAERRSLSDTDLQMAVLKDKQMFDLIQSGKKLEQFLGTNYLFR